MTLSNKPSKDTVISEINTSKENGFNQVEIDKINEMMNWLDEPWLTEVKNYITTNLTQDVISQLSVFKDSIEHSEKSSYWFDSLENGFEDNEIMKDFLDLVWSYIDAKLDWNFTDVEKDNVKLVMLWEIQSKLKISSAIDSIVSDLITPIRDLLHEWKLIKKDDKKAGEKTSEKEEKTTEISEVLEKFSNVCKSFGLEWELKKIDIKIEQINKEKKDNKKEFKFLNDVFYTVNWENKDDEQIFNDIKKQTEDLAIKINTWKEFWNYVADWVDKLPFNLWKHFKDFLRGIAEKFPIFWMFFSIIFWKEFLSESADKNKKATENLKKYAKNDDFPLKNYIKWEDLEKLENDKLKEFYEFMDSKEIDVSKDNFWKELLTWNTKNEEIKNLNVLLKNENWNILEKNENLDTLVSKLNWLNKVYENAEQKKVAEQQAQVESDSKKAKEAQAQADVAIQQAQADKENKIKKAKAEGKTWDDLKAVEAEAEAERVAAEKKAKEDKVKAQKAEEIARKKQQKIDFNNSILGIDKIPAVIKYKWEDLKLDIDNNNIILWENRYRISIMAINMEQFKKIEFKNGSFILNWDNDKKIEKSQIKDLSVKLLKWENFEYKWKTKWWISYTLKIIKV